MAIVEPNSRGHLGDAVAEALVLVGEGELGAFALRRLGDAIGDRAVRQSRPVTRIFLPESSPMASIIGRRAHLSDIAAVSSRMRRRLERSLSGLRARQEHPLHGVHGAPQAPRPGAVLHHRRIAIHPPDLRAAAAIPLPEAPLRARAAHRGGGPEAQGNRRRQVHRLRDPHPSGHPLPAASGVCRTEPESAAGEDRRAEQPL